MRPLNISFAVFAAAAIVVLAFAIIFTCSVLPPSPPPAPLTPAGDKNGLRYVPDTPLPGQQYYMGIDFDSRNPPITSQSCPSKVSDSSRPATVVVRFRP